MIRARLEVGRPPRAAALVTACCTALAVGAGGTNAAVPPVNAGRALAVAVPPDPLLVAAGKTGETTIRVINPTPTPIPITIAGRSITLEDNGRVKIGSHPDPRWGQRTIFPTKGLIVPARGYVTVPLRIRVPAKISPDLYFLGFLVAPTPTKAGSVQVVNQIGSFVTIDVPGPRLRKLLATLNAPPVVIGAQANATLKVSNVGHAAARFWAENDTTSTPGGSTAAQQRLAPSLLPRHRLRTFTVVSKPAWPIGLVTMTVHLIYPARTDSTTKEIVLSKRILVINPLLLYSLTLALSTAVLLAATRHRRFRSA
jgi:hypothetical protein